MGLVLGRSVETIYSCGCVRIDGKDRCPTHRRHKVAENSVEYGSKDQSREGKGLILRTRNPVIFQEQLRAGYDLVFISGKLSVNSAPIHLSILENASDKCVFVTVVKKSKANETKEYYESLGFNLREHRKSFMVTDLDKGSKYSYGNVLVFCNNKLPKKLLPNLVHLGSSCLFERSLISKLNCKYVLSVGDTSGKLHEVCQELDIQSFTHTRYWGVYRICKDRLYRQLRSEYGGLLDKSRIPQTLFN